MPALTLYNAVRACQSSERHSTTGTKTQFSGSSISKQALRAAFAGLLNQYGLETYDQLRAKKELELNQRYEPNYKPQMKYTPPLKPRI